MKHFAGILMTGLALVATASAGPLQKEQVAGDAKWVLHLDVEQLRASKLGNYFLTEIAEKQMTRPLDDMKRQFHFELDPVKLVEKVNSITAYGTEYREPQDNAVLVIKTDADLQKIVTGMLAGLGLAGPEP